MTIKNYTTSIKIEKTIGEIEQMLANIGATHIFKLYENGVPKGIAFNLEIKNNPISFKLPMREEKILLVFNNEVKKGKLPKSYSNNIEQARRTGWRIIKDWVDAQLALIKIEVAMPEEIFLPYVYDIKNNETLYEKIERQGFDNLLEYKNE